MVFNFEMQGRAGEMSLRGGYIKEIENTAEAVEFWDRIKAALAPVFAEEDEAADG